MFSALHHTRTRQAPEDPEDEIHLVSLLWGLLESAEDRGSSLYCLPSNPSRSARDSLSKFADLIGVKVSPQPLQFGDISQDEVTRMLSGCKIFEGVGEVDVTTLTNQICKYVPLGRRGTSRLPASLPDTIQFETANMILMEM